LSLPDAAGRRGRNDRNDEDGGYISLEHRDGSLLKEEESDQEVPSKV